MIIQILNLQILFTTFTFTTRMKYKFKKFRLLIINLSAKFEIKKSLFARVSDTKLFSTLDT